MLKRRLSPVEHCITTFMDDLAVALENVVRNIGWLLDLLSSWESIAGLIFHLGKTQVLCCWRCPWRDAMSVLTFVEPRMLSAKFAGSVLYLGARIGFDAHLSQWCAANRKIVARGHDIKALASGPSAAVLLHNCLASSCFPFLASFVDLDAKANFYLAVSVAAALSLPLYCIPIDILSNLKTFGACVQLIDMHSQARAAKFRVAVTSPALYAHEQAVNAVLASDDVMLAAHANQPHRYAPWMKRTICHTLIANRDALQTYVSCPSVSSCAAGLQRVTYHWIRALEVDGRSALLCLKVRRRKFLVGNAGIDSEDLLAPRLIHLCSCSSLPFAVSMFRSLLNGWITSWRFGGLSTPCRLRCGNLGAQDRQSHYLACSSMAASVHSTFSQLASIFEGLNLIDILLLNFSGGIDSCRTNDQVHGKPCKVCMAGFVNHVIIVSMNQLRHQYRHDGTVFQSRLAANARWLATRTSWAKHCMAVLTGSVVARSSLV